MKGWLHKLLKNVSVYTQAGFEVIVCGDFNAVYPVRGARKNTPNKKFGTLLYDGLKSCGLRPLLHNIKTYQSFSGDSESAVDNCFVTPGLSARCETLECEALL